MLQKIICFLLIFSSKIDFPSKIWIPDAQAVTQYICILSDNHSMNLTCIVPKTPKESLTVVSVLVREVIELLDKCPR